MEYNIFKRKIEKSKKIFNKIKYKNNKFYLLLYKIYLYLNTIDADSWKTVYKKYIYYFIESNNFYKWRDRINFLYANKSKTSHSEELFLNRYGKFYGKEKWLSYKSKIAMTKENMIIKYGEEEGLKRWNSYCEKQRRCGCSLEYFKEKYGDDGENIYKFVNKKKSHSLDIYIMKYGLNDGMEKYKKYWSEILNVKMYSKISQEFFNEIYKRIPSELKKHTYYGSLNKEYRNF